MRQVVKLGGSLLSRKDLLDALPKWFGNVNDSAGEPVESLVIVGGGGFVDAVRDLDRIRASDAVATHWICVQLMTTTVRLVQQWFPNWHFIATTKQLVECQSKGFATDYPSLVSVSSFYHSECESGLPADWRTTSDSIAAQLAIDVAADQLVLLKSCEVNPAASVKQLAENGIVDEALPMISGIIPRVIVERL